MPEPQGIPPHLRHQAKRSPIAKAGEATISATAAKVSEGAAKVSEESAADSARTATTKAGEATASAAAAGVSEANAAASATAASASATIASAAQTAAEAAYEETKKVAVLPATTTSRGSVMPDGATIGVKEDGTITAKDVAIGGDQGDLASKRGQIGDTVIVGTVDFNTLVKQGVYSLKRIVQMAPIGRPTARCCLPKKCSKSGKTSCSVCF